MEGKGWRGLKGVEGGMRGRGRRGRGEGEGGGEGSGDGEAGAEKGISK